MRVFESRLVLWIKGYVQGKYKTYGSEEEVTIWKIGVDVNSEARRVPANQPRVGK
jgi:viroplasmin and RNaseH domain-containing protein